VCVCVCVCVSHGIDLSSSSHSVAVIRIISNLAFKFHTVNSMHYDEATNSCNTNKRQIITPKHVATL